MWQRIGHLVQQSNGCKALKTLFSLTLCIPSVFSFGTLSSTTTRSASDHQSGYVSAVDFTGNSENNTVTQVAGTWIAPALEATTDASYCSIWIGMDGFLSDSIERIGTSHNWVDGVQQNYAWFEMYPNGPCEMSSFPVANGDVIRAEMIYQGEDTFNLVLSNLTQKVSTVLSSSCQALRSSAEWIVEAPRSDRVVSPLSDFKSIVFSDCSAVINGVSGTVSNPAWQTDEITMESSIGVEARPTDLSEDGSSFEVIWQSE